MPRPSQPVRLLMAIALVLAVAALALTLLKATDSALTVWQRLQDLPGWIQTAFLIGLGLLGLGAGWGVWRLLRPSRTRAPKVAPLDRGAVEERIAQLGGEERAALRATQELQELDRRREQDQVQVALFGEISSGKSSLLRALAPPSNAAVGVIGGTTQQVTRHLGQLPDGTAIELADVPGLHESGGEPIAQLARAEAARAHAVIYIADGDLTRAQDAELRALSGFGRPLLLLLNKIDRYSAEERTALRTRLQQRYADVVMDVLEVSAGYEQETWREWPDGRRERVMRECAPELGRLPETLRRLAGIGAQQLEAGREAALLAHVDADLAQGERESRLHRSEAAVKKYTRRAIVGALAAVAPGTDLVIQGALATALVRELCRIHGLAVRDIDLDAFLGRAGGLVRTTTSITLAIAGNALKSFPGLGTLGGGMLHAVAYGLIFDSLGRAVTQTLADTAALDRDATLLAFRQRLEQPAAERLKALATLALEAWRERDHDPHTPSDRPSMHTVTRED